MRVTRQDIVTALKQCEAHGLGPRAGMSPPEQYRELLQLLTLMTYRGVDEAEIDAASTVAQVLSSAAG